MNKILLLLALLLPAQNLFGAYKIKIAVYKDHANLMTYVSKISEKEYRKNILIEEKNHLHYVTLGTKFALSLFKKRRASR